MMIYKHNYEIYQQKQLSLLWLIYVLIVLFYSWILSYFAEPNFIIYDEWFDDDLEKTKLKNQEKKTKVLSNIHDFFYSQSNYKIGASENTMQVDIKVNNQELIFNNYIDNISESYSSESDKKFKFLSKFIERTLKKTIIKKLIFSLSIFSFIFIFGFSIFFISQARKSKSNLTNNSFSMEKEFWFSKRDP